jgi:hypothetical protein
MKKSLIFILAVIGLALSCNKPDNQPSTPDTTVPTDQNVVLQNLTTGTFTDLSTSTIGQSGAVIKISKPGTPVDGLQITVPANAYTTNPTLKIAYAEVKSHQFGSNFNPISPLISISLDGGYSNELMSVTIPVTIPAGHIPLGFYVDNVTGKLEGIPFSSIGANSITLLTRHFLPASKLKSGNILKSTAPTGANIIISSISESILNGLPIISSGFKPGTDDWEFVNYGSYIAPGGHCAGQNMTAMWYYFEKKPSEGKLFNRFSDNPNIWEDNARGYKFASVIHKDLQWDGLFASIFDKFIDRNQTLDKQKLLTIAGVMLITGEPQGVGIYRQTGTKTDGTPTYGGHDLICYQVSVSSGKLYISDPNTPGIGQSIDLANDKFLPYMAKLNGNDVSNPYPYVTFYAKTAYIEWDKIGKRWAEVLDNKIGTVAPNTFPLYTFWAKDGAGYEVKDGLTVNVDSLRTMVICPTAEVSYTVQNQKIIGHIIVDKDGKALSNAKADATSATFLKPGPNILGTYIFGWRESSKTNNIYNNRYVDFKWLTVTNIPLTIAPILLYGELSKSYSFTATSKGAAPKSAKYVWDFGDGGSQLTKLNDSTATYSYSKEGSYTIKVELYDNSTGKKLVEASSAAIISKATVSRYADWLTIKNMSFELTTADVVYSNGDHPSNVYFKYNTTTSPWGLPYTTKSGPTVNGTTFSFTGNYSLSPSGEMTSDSKIVTITANVNAGATFLLSLKYDIKEKTTYAPMWDDITSKESNTTIELQNIPASLPSLMDFEPPKYTDITPYVKTITNEYKETHSNASVSGRSITSYKCNGGYIYLSFTK